MALLVLCPINKLPAGTFARNDRAFVPISKLHPVASHPGRGDGSRAVVRALRKNPRVAPFGASHPEQSEKSGQDCWAARRLPESKDLAAASFAAVMMSHLPRAHASTQGHLDAIRKTHLLSSLWEVWSSGTLSLRSGRQDLATHSSNASSPKNQVKTVGLLVKA